MKFNKLIPLVAATALGLGTSNIAQAGAYAYAYVNVTDLSINFDPVVPLTSISFDSSASAATSGAAPGFLSAFVGSDANINPDGSLASPLFNTDVGNAAQAASQVGAPGVIAVGDASYAGVANNVWTPLSAGGATGTTATFIDENGSRGDSAVVQSQFVDGLNTEVRAVAESERATSGGSSANGAVGSTTGFQFTAQVAADTVITFDFDAEVYLRTILHDDVATGSSRADTDVNFEIRNSNDLVVFSWSPDGTSTATGGTVNSEAFSLLADIGATPTDRVSTYDPTGTGAVSGVLGGFNVSTDALAAGTYTLALSINAHTIQNATKVPPVPEPTTLLMLGMGIIGLGFNSRKKRAA